MSLKPSKRRRAKVVRPWRPSKYNIGPKETRTSWDGIVFQSKMEMHRYEFLLEMLRLNLIDDLERQVPYPVVVNGRKICTYKSDFNYRVVLTGEKIIEDVKGARTAVYKLKKKLVEAIHGITLTEVTRATMYGLEHPDTNELKKIYDKIQELRKTKGLPEYQPLVRVT
jgi:hypothetical protein